MKKKIIKILKKLIKKQKHKKRVIKTRHNDTNIGLLYF